LRFRPSKADEELARKAEDAVTRGKKMCEYCSKTNHTTANCYKKLADSGGKPPGAQARPQQNRINHIQGAQYYVDDLDIHSCQMQVKQGRKYKKTPPRRKDTARQRILIDSGANMIAFQTAARGRAANLVPYFAGVATASGSSNTNLGVSQKGNVGIIFQSGLSIEPDVVFIDDLKHNVAGSTVLDTQYGVTSVFHNGMVHLVDSSSINGLPQSWKMLASSHYDKKRACRFWTLIYRACRIEILWAQKIKPVPIRRRAVIQGNP